MKAFRKQLLKTTRKAFFKREISLVQLFATRWATRDPEILEELRGAVIDQAVCEGLLEPAAADAPEAIDWSALAEFFERIIPLIMQIIAMFL